MWREGKSARLGEEDAGWLRAGKFRMFPFIFPVQGPAGAYSLAASSASIASGPSLGA